MKKWIAIVLLVAMLGSMVCYADVSETEELEIILEDDSQSSEDELDIEMESSEPTEEGDILLDDVSLEDPDLIELELDTELTGNEFEVDSSALVLANSVNSSTVYGVWEGNYIGRLNGNAVDRTIRLDIDNVIDNSIEGIATIDEGENGSYFFDGTLDVENGNIVFRGTDWIDNPNNFSFSTFSGILNGTDNTIEGIVDGNENQTFVLHKTSDTYISKRIDIQTVPKDWKGEYDGYHNSTIVRRNYEMHIQSLKTNGEITGIAYISPSDKSDSTLGVNGSYYFSGVIDGRRGKIRIKGSEWIKYPDKYTNWEFVSLEGFFDSSLSSIVGSSDDGIWNMSSYDSELDGFYSTQPTYPIIIGTKDGTKAEFNESLERYITNMDSDKYYPDLAYMLVALAGAAYNRTGTQGGQLTIENAGYKSDSQELYHITKAYEDLGFADYNAYNYFNNPNDSSYGSDNVAFTIGRKQLSDDDALVLIVVRGSYGGIFSYTSDWQSNTKIKTNSNGRHLGFARAADKVYKALKSFMKNRQFSDATMKSNVRYVITGHSRGAAVANLLAVKLHDVGVPNSKVYDYNFACPDTVKGYKLADMKKNHENIFNICNSADLVSMIPGIVGDAVSGVGYSGLDIIKEKFKSLFVSWGKYGTTWFYCKDWNDPKEFDLLRTLNKNNSPHDTKYYIPDIGKNTYKFYSWSEIITRGIALNGTASMSSIVNMLYPGYAIDQGDITKAKVTVSDQVYTGKTLKPTVKVVLNNKTLKKGTDYTVSYKNNKSIGTASVILKGKGSYRGTKTVTFKINPKPVTGLKLTVGKGQITVAWDKATGINGYQLQYSLKKSFASAKKVTINKAANVKKVLKSLKKGNVYYIRIRAYKKVNGKTYWSAWSSAKKATVK